MANTLITSQMIANEALVQFKNSLGFTKGANRQYDDSFAVKGAKIGNSIGIRMPQRYVVSDGAALVKQNIVNETKTLTLDQRKHVGFEFSTQELSLSIDKFSETYITPAATALANKVDSTGLALASKIANAVGTVGTPLNGLDVTLDAGQKLSEFSCPEGDRHIILNPKNMNKMVSGNKGLFQSSERISEQYEKGVMGIAGGFKFRQSNNVLIHTVGPLGGTPLVNGATASGATSLVTDGWIASAAARLKQGDVFTIAGVLAVNPVTFQSTGELQQFVVTADVSSDGSGNATIPIYPAIISSAGGNLQTVSALPADNAPLTIVGTANAVSPLNLAYHKDAFILGCADLEMPKGVDMASYARDAESGLSIRFVRFYDGESDQLVSRLDILFGWLAARPEWAARMHG